MGQNPSRQLISYLGILFFLAPLTVLLVVVKRFSFIDTSEVSWALGNTFFQAGLSLLLFVTGSFIGGLGLLAIKDGARKNVIRLLISIPYFLPPLFAVLAAGGWEFLFPRNLIGVSLLHAWINIGIGSIIAESYFRRRFVDDAKTVLVFGLNKTDYLRKVVLPQSYPLIKAFVLGFFPLFFSSFTIPLILGGTSGTTIEVLIYEKIRLDTDWGSALFLSGLQIVIQAVVLGVFKDAVILGREENDSSMKWLGSKAAAIFILSLSGIFLVKIIHSFWGPFPEFSNLKPVLFDSINLIIISSVLFFIGFCKVLYFRPKTFQKFLDIFNSPGSALVAFAFVILSLYFSELRDVFLFWSFIILFFPILFRLVISSRLGELAEQIQSAEIYGASSWQIFSQIVYPQTKGYLIIASAIAGLWCLGDFSVARIIISSNEYLGLLLGDTLQSYRIANAGPIAFLILILGIFNLFVIFVLANTLEKVFRCPSSKM